MNVIGKLEAAEYWNWRFLIAEMQHEETKAKLKSQVLSGMEKDLEIAKLKTFIYKKSIQDAQDKVKEAQLSYHEFKAQLEEKYGFSFNNTTINDITLEISKLDEE
jgi:hypothetical protein